jgi:hypothetical protein
MTRPPLNRGKSDRLLNPGATAAEIRCDHAVAPWDRVAIEMERRWGIGKLPGLVSPAMAEMYGGAVAFMNEMINEGDSARCAAAAENCIKGLRTMDAAAQAAGHSPLHYAVWEYEQDGKRIGVVCDVSELQIIQDAHPELKLYTMRQVFNGMAIYDNEVVRASLEAFPGAKVSAIRPKTELEDSLDDEVPF